MYSIYGGLTYYAQGGAHDLLERYNIKAIAIKRAEDLIGYRVIIRKWEDQEPDFYKIEWSHVTNLKGDIIAEFGNRYGSSHTPILGIEK